MSAMTLDNLIDRLIAIRDQVGGKEDVLIWDPDSESWEPVSVIEYSGGEPTKLYSDEP